MSKQASIETKETKKPSLKYLRDKDRQKVKGIFQFHECPGGELSFVFRFYREDPIEKFTLQDGKTYELPLGVARHLNQNGWYPVHHYQTDETGAPVMEIGEKRNRYSFRSLEFMGTEDIEESSQIVTAKPVA